MGIMKTIFASSYGPDKTTPFFFWFPPGTPLSEKRLLCKIDFFILTYGCLAYFTKWLDQANLSNAYVSGMREDLRMYGTEYNIAVTCFQVGAILGPIPSNLLLTRIKPRYLLPGCELLWAILTVFTYKVTTYSQVCSSPPRAVRVFPRVFMLMELALPNTLFHRLPRRFLLRRRPVHPRLLVQTQRARQTLCDFLLLLLRRDYGERVSPKCRSQRLGRHPRHSCLEMGVYY